MTFRPIRKILCAIDFSEHSMDVLRQAFDAGLHYNARLLILNVVNERTYNEFLRIAGRLDMTDGVADQAVNAMEDAREEQMRDILAQLRVDKTPVDKVPHISRIVAGVPHERILQVAEEEGVDLIVLGAKGRTSLRQSLRFGSTAEKVFRRGDLPVLIAR